MRDPAAQWPHLHSGAWLLKMRKWWLLSSSAGVRTELVAGPQWLVPNVAAPAAVCPMCEGACLHTQGFVVVVPQIHHRHEFAQCWHGIGEMCSQA